MYVLIHPYTYLYTYTYTYCEWIYTYLCTVHKYCTLNFTLLPYTVYLKVCEKLRKEDPIRLEYYIFRESELHARFNVS